MHRRLAQAVALAVVSTALVGSSASSARAAGPGACSDLLLVAARGSGQTLADDRSPTSESSTFFGEVRKHTPPGITIKEYRLGDPGINGFAYPAVNWRTKNNAFSFGKRYDDSVATGVRELAALLIARHRDCPLEEWIIGGYSQGGEVVSRTMSVLSQEVRAHVGFAATFGDPMLDAFGGLPCRRGWWVRGNVKCYQHGILGPRVPYVPSDMKGRFGAWCDWLDVVCSMGGDVLGKAHARYPDAAIPAAGLEAAATVRGRHGWTLQQLDLGTGSTGTDVMVVFDTTGSMGGAIAQARAAAVDLADQILARRNGRIGLVEFKDAGDFPPVQLVQGLTSDRATFANAVDSLVASGGGDWPEAQLAGIMTALDSADWRTGATKLIVTITDAPGKDPDQVTGVTGADVVRRANEIDPVGAYGVDLCGCAQVRDFMAPLAAGTGGGVVNGTGDLAEAIGGVFERAGARPIVQLADSFYSEPGESVTISAEGSYDPDSEIVGYRWDLDGDGRFETDTPDPVVTRTFSTAGTHTIAAMAVADDGGTGTAVTTVEVRPGWRADRTPGSPRDVGGAETGAGHVQLRWQPPGTGVVPTGYTVLDGSGVALALLPATARTFDVAGLPQGTTQHFSVAAAANGMTGEPVRVTVALAGPKAPPPPRVEPKPRERAVTARLRSHRARVAHGRISLKLACPAVASSDCVTALRVAHRPSGVLAGRTVTTIAKGSSRTVAIRLRHRRLARPGRDHVLRVTLATQTTAGTAKGLGLVLLKGRRAGP